MLPAPTAVAAFNICTLIIYWALNLPVEHDRSVVANIPMQFSAYYRDSQAGALLTLRDCHKAILQLLSPLELHYVFTQLMNKTYTLGNTAVTCACSTHFLCSLYTGIIISFRNWTDNMSDRVMLCHGLTYIVMEGHYINKLSECRLPM